MKIAVYGSAAGEISPDVKIKARQIGKEIAKLKHTVITGACLGYPQYAVLGAMELNGKAIGFSPFADMETHKKFDYPTEGFTKINFLSKELSKYERAIATKFRNVASVNECDACVLIGGRAGTLNEFTIAYDSGKKIAVLEESGGITKFIKKLVDDFKKPTGAMIVYDKDPAKLIEKLLNL